jgi:hypothetical protein
LHLIGQGENKMKNSTREKLIEVLQEKKEAHRITAVGFRPTTSLKNEMVNVRISFDGRNQLTMPREAFQKEHDMAWAIDMAYNWALDELSGEMHEEGRKFFDFGGKYKSKYMYEVMELDLEHILWLYTNNEKGFDRGAW